MCAAVPPDQPLNNADALDQQGAFAMDEQDTRLDTLLASYRTRTDKNFPLTNAQMPDAEATWQAIQSNLNTPVALPDLNHDELVELASTWCDSPALVAEVCPTFEAALPQLPQANQWIADFQSLSHHLYQYAKTLENAVAVEVTDSVMATYRQEQAIQRVREQQVAEQASTVVELFPRWLVSTAAACLLLVTVALNQPSPVEAATMARVTDPSNTPLLAMAQAVAPTVESYMLTSCAEDLPTHEWQLVSNCQY